MTEVFHSYDGTKLAYRTRGGGPLLVCIPGGPGRAAAYLGDLAGLDATNTLLLLDSRGTGESELPADETTYAAESLARDVDALREHLGLERMRVLGHSAGGGVAIRWAAAHPDRVEKLVVVTSTLSSENREALVAEVMEKRRGEPWFAEAFEAAEGMPYARGSEKQRLERMQRPFWYGAWGGREQEHAASADGQTSPRAAARFREQSSWTDLRPQLAQLTAPTLVVTGELDGLLPPSLGRGVAEAIPGAAYEEIAGAGHFPWVDQPEAFARVVGEFLAA